MAAGDSGRTWFSEMVDVLRDQWHPALSCEELIALAKRLDVMVRQIRQEVPQWKLAQHHSQVQV